MSKVTSKGQITVPKAVREALSLDVGDTLLFRVEGDRAVVSKVPEFLDLAATVEVPPEMRGMSWEEVRRRAWTARWRG